MHLSRFHSVAFFLFLFFFLGGGLLVHYLQKIDNRMAECLLLGFRFHVRPSAMADLTAQNPSIAWHPLVDSALTIDPTGGAQNLLLPPASLAPFRHRPQALSSQPWNTKTSFMNYNSKCYNTITTTCTCNLYNWYMCCLVHPFNVKMRGKTLTKYCKYKTGR